MDNLWQCMPAHWLKSCDISLVEIFPDCYEYKTLKEELKNQRIYRFEKILRHQNIYWNGQFLVRQQQLRNLNPDTTYYTTRRYITIPVSQVNDAINYQLDYENVNRKITFDKFTNAEIGEAILLTQIVTASPLEAFEPTRDYDFYIEYIIII